MSDADANELGRLAGAFRTILRGADASAPTAEQLQEILSADTAVEMGAPPADAEEVAGFMRAVFNIFGDGNGSIDSLPDPSPAVCTFVDGFRAAAAAALAAPAAAEAAAAARSADLDGDAEGVWETVDDVLRRQGLGDLADLVRIEHAARHSRPSGSRQDSTQPGAEPPADN